MNKLPAAFLSALCFLFACSPAPKPTLPKKAKNILIAQFDSLQTLTEKKLLLLSQNGPADSVRQAFLRTRRAYKKIEWFTEYYAPTASRELNGAPLPEIEIEETKVFEPSGLQVIEEYVYEPLTAETRPELVREVKSFLSTLSRTRDYLNQTTFTEAHLLDAGKQEIYRVMVTGISGFDTPLAKTGISEAAVALQSVKHILTLFGTNPELTTLFNQAITYLNQHSDFDSFNRLVFITRFANPLTAAITNWQKTLGIEPLPAALALSPSAPTLFAPEAINPNYFTGSPEAQLTPEKIALGKSLFFNPVIAGNARTCASCHQPQLAFTDGLAKSAALTPGKTVPRNAPTLLYAGLQTAQFYDMRSPTLENQAMDVLANKDEMHTSVEEVTRRLNESEHSVQQFKAAFPGMTTEIRPRYVMIALASYIRSLTPFNSRFDKYLHGGQNQLTALEEQGFNLFMGKAKCGTCHFMPVFNGTAAPSFANTEAEVLGVPTNFKTPKPNIDPDLGRYTHNKIDELKFAFKTPTIRNVELTAPYMHNGAFKTLEEVIDFYDNGGGAGLGITLPNQTLPTDKLNLTPTEKQALKAFLLTLTDSTVLLP